MSDLAFFFGAFAVGIATLGWIATRLAHRRFREREGLRRMSTLDIEDALRLKESRERLGRLGNLGAPARCQHHWVSRVGSAFYHCRKCKATEAVKP